MKYRYTLPLLFLHCTGPVFAADYANVTVSQITSIYDADTFRVNIPGYPPIIGEHISIRVNGVDAPEIRGKCPSEKIAARQARQFTVDMLQSSQQIELRNMKRGKYFRIIADVYTDGDNLAEALIRAGHAREYHGEKRSGWCKEKVTLNSLENTTARDPRPGSPPSLNLKASK